MAPLLRFPQSKKHFKNFHTLSVILCGNHNIIDPEISDYDSSLKQRITVQHCSEEVAMDEMPTTALRNKKDSSMRRMLEFVNEGKADACVSAGNTGALLAMAYYVLKTLPGIDRPALISTLPTNKQDKVYLLDLGANINCDAETLFQYAVMGAVMAEQVSGIECPRVALLNVGEEQIKGNEKVKYAAKLLEDAPGINYIGFVEGDHIFDAKADVVVTDGFCGQHCT